MIPKTKVWLFGGLSVTFFAVASASSYMRMLLEDKIFNQSICQMSTDLLQHHEKGLAALGEPLSFMRPTLRNTFNNVTKTDMSIAVRVSGSKAAGNLLIRASKPETDSEWNLKSLVLEIPKDKIVIK